MAIKSGVKVKTFVDPKKITAAVNKLNSLQVLVGVPAANNSHKSDDGEIEEITNSQIGFINEFGAPELNIPPRPHLVPGIRDNQKKINNYLKQAGEAALDGDSARIDRALNAAGITAVNGVQRKITTGPFTPLANRTIADRIARGRKGTKPLIDTGQYRRSITYVVRKKAKT